MFQKIEDEQPEQESNFGMSEAKRRKTAIALLQSWHDANEEDAQEQRDTYNFLVQSLNVNLLPRERRRI